MFANISYTEYFDPDRGDPNTTKLPLLGYPLPVWTLSVLYLVLVLKIGPYFMKNRTAYGLKGVLLVYNITQILLNFIIGYSALQLQWRYDVYDLGCCRTLPSGHPHKSLEIWTSYAYFIMKILDLLDTMFFVLRKSWKQISFLHVYHHVMMINAVYTVMHFFGAGGELYFVLVLNSFIHSIMYSYYLITAVFPQFRSFALRWKRYITLMQLTQFIIILIHNAYPLLLRWDCNYSRFNVFNVIQSVVMITLFTNFYIKSYKMKQIKGKGEGDGDGNNDGKRESEKKLHKN